MASYPTYGSGPAVVTEKVGLGLLFSLLAIPAGMIVAVILWRIGFIAGISSFVIAAGAVFLYTKGASTLPRTGLIPLLLLIIVGIALSFFATAASDLWDYYGKLGIQSSDESRFTFIKDNIFNGDFLKANYATRDIVFFVVFAVLGVFSTMRRVVASH